MASIAHIFISSTFPPLLPANLDSFIRPPLLVFLLILYIFPRRASVILICFFSSSLPSRCIPPRCCSSYFYLAANASSRSLKNQRDVHESFATLNNSISVDISSRLYILAPPSLSHSPDTRPIIHEAKYPIKMIFRTRYRSFSGFRRLDSAASPKGIILSEITLSEAIHVTVSSSDFGAV